MGTATRETETTRTLDFEARPIRKVVRRVRMDERRRAFFGGDRRVRQRVPLRRPVYVTPVLIDGSTMQLPATERSYTIAYTMNVSSRGIAFTHDEPILTRHAVVTFDLVDAEPVSLVVQIQWSRCRGDHWYASGGKFIAVTETIPNLLYVPDSASSSLN